MNDDLTPQERPSRRKAPPPARLDEAYMLEPEAAAFYLAQIGKTTLDRLVLAGKITPRQLSKGRVGYLRRELEALADSLPKITPGRRKPQGETQGA